MINTQNCEKGGSYACKLEKKIESMSLDAMSSDSLYDLSVLDEEDLPVNPSVSTISNGIGGYFSPPKGRRSLQQEEAKMTNLEKENFDLKMQVFHMEARVKSLSQDRPALSEDDDDVDESSSDESYGALEDSIIHQGESEVTMSYGTNSCLGFPDIEHKCCASGSTTTNSTVSSTACESNVSDENPFNSRGRLTSKKRRKRNRNKAVLKRLLMEKNKTLAEQSSDLRERDIWLDQARNAIELLQKDWNISKNTVVEMEEEKSKILHDLEESRKRGLEMEKNSSIHEELVAEHDDLLSQYNSLERNLEAADAEKCQLQDDIDRQHEQLNHIKKGQGEMMNHVKTMLEKEKQTKESINADQAELVRMREERNSLDQHCILLNSQLQQSLHHISERDIFLEQARIAIEDLKEKNGFMASENALLQQNRNKFTNEELVDHLSEVIALREELVTEKNKNNLYPKKIASLQNMVVSTNNELLQLKEVASSEIQRMKEFVSHAQKRLSQSRGEKRDELVCGTLALSVSKESPSRIKSADKDNEIVLLHETISLKENEINRCRSDLVTVNDFLKSKDTELLKLRVSSQEKEAHFSRTIVSWEKMVDGHNDREEESISNEDTSNQGYFDNLISRMSNKITNLLSYKNSAEQLESDNTRLLIELESLREERKRLVNMYGSLKRQLSTLQSEQKRWSLKDELDTKMKEADQVLRGVTRIVHESVSFVEKVESGKESPTVQEHQVLKEPHCTAESNENGKGPEAKHYYKLLDANARLSVQLQQMCTDLRKVYSRFKKLEARTNIASENGCRAKSPSKVLSKKVSSNVVKGLTKNPIEITQNRIDPLRTPSTRRERRLPMSL